MIKIKIKIKIKTKTKIKNKTHEYSSGKKIENLFSQVYKFKQENQSQKWKQHTI